MLVLQRPRGGRPRAGAGGDVMIAEADAPAPATEDDDHLRRLVTRLARPHASGGHVVEHAALRATAGRDLGDALEWIEARGGRPEHAAAAVGRGLYGDRATASGPGVPLRHVLPPGALG